jgi:hypothetical protein
LRPLSEARRLPTIDDAIAGDEVLTDSTDQTERNRGRPAIFSHARRLMLVKPAHDVICFGNATGGKHA